MDNELKVVAMYLIVGLLFVTTAFQAVEINKLQTEITEFKATPQPVTRTVSVSPQTLAKNLANLPKMQGGC